jgi:hypothetical protein
MDYLVAAMLKQQLQEEEVKSFAISSNGIDNSSFARTGVHLVVVRSY